MNENLKNAMKNKNDEFYTLYKDVKFELDHYKDKFKDKIILCNCNDKGSAFEKYFTENNLGIKELIITEGRFQDNLKALERCDIVVTNPPFSQFREFVDLLVKYDKDFIIIGTDNVITYKNVFPLIKEEKVFLGYNKVKEFIEPNGNIKKFGNIGWYTTFKTERPQLELTATYDPEKYPKYDNYDAIEVSKIKDIPKGYDGVMGVPITFINKWNKDQFEVIGLTSSWYYGNKKSKLYPKQIQHSKNGKVQRVTKLNDGPSIKINKPLINKTYYEVDGEYYKGLYARILIKKKGS